MFTLGKRHKLCSTTAIDALFAHGGKGALAFPLRMVARRDDGRTRGEAVQFLISVPKKRLRHAVDRVTMRRRVREAYRLNRVLIPALPEGARVDVAFVYVSSDVQPYHKVERAMQRLLPLIVQLTAAQ